MIVRMNLDGVHRYAPRALLGYAHMIGVGQVHRSMSTRAQLSKSLPQLVVRKYDNPICTVTGGDTAMVSALCGWKQPIA
jgi:hypothetical protein